MMTHQLLVGDLELVPDELDFLYWVSSQLFGAGVLRACEQSC